ncbi:hypothetical protein ACFV2U_30295 [Streptomyces sp. NPDC059697]|uniref:hypothetical protein n=1 Tax=Streptomyces sp. NPDC059697 TaxID=3346912 RepID=UPI0036775BCC
MVLTLIAALTMAFTEKYPKDLYDLVLGLNRWVLRVTVYAAPMKDAYPPFRQDTGGSEPGWSGLSPAPCRGAGRPGPGWWRKGVRPPAPGRPRPPGGRSCR